jgi:hypothetical protein
MEYENEISQQDAGSPATNLPDRKNAKQNGELAELIFMGKAVSLGFGVAKPWGDSQRFDFILSRGERLWRVQVKSTTHVHRRGYKVGARKRSIQGQVAYTPKEIDILVAYIVPREIYYVIPAAAVQGLTALCLYPSETRKGAGHFEQYREAWHLMMPAADPEPVTADPASAAPALAELSPVKDARE